MKLWICAGIVGFAPCLAAQSPIWSGPGFQAGEHFGDSVCVPGDLNGDGIPDVVAGSPNFTSPAGAVGYVRACLGTSGPPLWITLGTSAGELFGHALSGVGDVNGDGIVDILVGAPLWSVPGFATGRVLVLSGVDGTLLMECHGAAALDLMGKSVAGLNDVTGDGIADFAVGAPQGLSTLAFNSGFVLIYSGATGQAVRAITGPASFGLFGWSVSDAGDLNHDGKDDLVIGAPLAAPAGTAYVYSSNGTMLFSSNGSAAGSFFGGDVSGLGDTNRDGVVDWGVGAEQDPTNGASAGSLRVLSGADGSMFFQRQGGPGEQMGRSVAPAGDINSDGYADVLVGLYSYASASTLPGYVELYSGKDGARVWRIAGPAPGALFGGSLALLGDANGDGFPDFVVGAADKASTSAGLVTACSAIPAGISIVGTQTVGCGGPHQLAGSTTPRIGTPSFAFSAGNAPPNSLGLCLVTNALDPVGADPFGIGILLFGDVYNATEIYGLDFIADAVGVATAPAALPNAPSLVGVSYTAQGFFAWPPGGCSPSPYSLSSTLGVVLTIQP